MDSQVCWQRQPEWPLPYNWTLSRCHCSKSLLANHGEGLPGQGIVVAAVQWAMGTFGKRNLCFKSTAVFGCPETREESLSPSLVTTADYNVSAMESDVLSTRDLFQKSIKRF